MSKSRWDVEKQQGSDQKVGDTGRGGGHGVTRGRDTIASDMGKPGLAVRVPSGI